MSSRSPHGLSLIQDLLNTLWSHTSLKARQKSSRLRFAQMIQAGRQSPYFLEICLVRMLGKFFQEIFYKSGGGDDEDHESGVELQKTRQVAFLTELIKVLKPCFTRSKLY